VENAGLAEYIGRVGLTVIEWPERLGSLRPAARLDVFLEAVSEQERVCSLEGWGERAEELRNALAARQP
jgi:tRNA A37 threonylcarbamoyladenosine biosynthesis protein TsaE